MIFSDNNPHSVVPEDPVTITVLLDRDLVDQVDALAKETGQTRGDIIVAAATDYLERRGV